MTAAATEIAALDATAQAALVRSGQVSAAELVDGAIDRIERLNPQLNAVVIPLFEQARAAVADVTPTGPFAGVPFLPKDLVVEIEGTPLREGSMFLRDNVSTFTCELVTRLRRAGLVMVGRTNSPEFGMVPACEPQVHGPTRNPWDPRRSTSGSSGGSAAAVASGMVPMAHGNDMKFSRTVATFLSGGERGGVDLWLTPTMSQPVARIGEIASTPAEPLKALERGAPTVAYPLVVANITGNPAMSVPLAQAPDGMPIGMHFLGRFGDEATLLRLAAQLELARPWAALTPPIHATR